MTIRIDRVLAATDFSKAGQRAAHVAAMWARQARAQLRIVHVTPPEPWLSRLWGVETRETESIQGHARNALKQLAESVDAERGLELSTGVLSGAAARSIAAAARDYRADLLVIGARGERDVAGERTLGGTAEKLLASVEPPLLLVRRMPEDPIGDVVAALDLSPRARAVLEWADLAAAERHLHAYHVYDVPFAARLETYGLAPSAVDTYAEQERAQRRSELAAIVASVERRGPTSQVIERGDPAVCLTRFVESVRPSLVVLGKHRNDVPVATASSVGSVSRFTARIVATDVLLV